MGNHISTLILVRGVVKSLLLNIRIIVLALDLGRDHKSSLPSANIFLDKDRINVLKASSRKHFLTSKSYLKYVFLKTSCWRCLSSMSCRCRKNNLKMSKGRLEDAFRVTLFHLPRRFQDVFARRLPNTSSQRLQEVLENKKSLLGFIFISSFGKRKFRFSKNIGVDGFICKGSPNRFFNPSIPSTINVLTVAINEMKMNIGNIYSF